MLIALKYFTVYAISSIKFILGPIFGKVYHLPEIFIVLLSVLGMMTTIYLFTFFGISIRKFFSRFKKEKSRIFSKKSRRFVMLWNRFGLIGVCFLTPILLSPIGGGLLVNLVESRKSLILKWMWISAFFWGIVIVYGSKYFSEVFFSI